MRCDGLRDKQLTGYSDPEGMEPGTHRDGSKQNQRKSSQKASRVWGLLWLNKNQYHCYLLWHIV